jgi:hypothetical protein
MERPMMSSMMVFSLLGGLLLVAAVVFGVVLMAKSGGTAAKLGLAVLAVVGGLALIGVLAMWFMRTGMMDGMMGCCG